MKKSPKSDPQRSRVYEMERHAVANHLHHKMSERDLRTTLRALSEAIDVPQPKLQIRRMGNDYVGDYTIESSLIRVDAKLGMNLRTLMHEYAHHVHQQHTYKGEPAHSPRWVRIYFQLLDMTRMVPIEGMLAVARQYGVKVQRKSRLPFPIPKQKGQPR